MCARIVSSPKNWSGVHPCALPFSQLIRSHFRVEFKGDAGRFSLL